MLEKLQRAWMWVKENAFAVGAAVGAVAVAVVAFFFNRDDSELIEIKKQSNKDQAETAKKNVERIEEFVTITEKIREEKERKGEELTREEEENLEERKRLYSEAETKEEMEKVIEDVKKVYPELTYVPPSLFGKVGDE